MNLNKYKFKRKEDKAVFKALIRCMKEDGNLYFLKKRTTGGRHGFDEIVRRCYDSRERHAGENFQTNIFYWPEDCGGLLKSHPSKLLYLALVINSLNCKIKELGIRFIELYNSICLNPKGLSSTLKRDFSAYNKCICDAFVKCGESEASAKDRADSIELLLKACKMNLPL